MLSVSLLATRRRGLRRRVTPPAATAINASPIKIHHSISYVFQVHSPRRRRPAASPRQPPHYPPPRDDRGQYRRGPTSHQKALTNLSRRVFQRARDGTGGRSRPP